jgi:hypothetical protein
MALMSLVNLTIEAASPCVWFQYSGIKPRLVKNLCVYMMWYDLIILSLLQNIIKSFHMDRLKCTFICIRFFLSQTCINGGNDRLFT